MADLVGCYHNCCYHTQSKVFLSWSLLKPGKGKVAQQAAGYGEIREGKETARDEEIWQKGT